MRLSRFRPAPAGLFCLVVCWALSPLPALASGVLLGAGLELARPVTRMISTFPEGESHMSVIVGDLRNQISIGLGPDAPLDAIIGLGDGPNGSRINFGDSSAPGRPVFWFR